jgi:beta-glucosidase
MNNSKSWTYCMAVLISCMSLYSCMQSTEKSAGKQLSASDAGVQVLLSRMTLEEKIGQMTQVEQDQLKDIGDIGKYFLGSLFSGGNSDPKEGNSLQAWADMVDRYQSAAVKTRLAIPLLYGVDAVHGHNNVLGAVIFPHNIGMGCTRNPALVEKEARIAAEEVRATGANWTFAPCVTVARDERWGRTYKGYGETPELARLMGEAAVRGFQGLHLGNPLDVLGCAKHFVGDGGTTWGTGRPVKQGSDERYPLDQGDTRLDAISLREIHMQGYVSTVRAGVGSIMPSYNSWNGVKCSGSYELMTRILKEEMKFEGFLISDYAALNQLPGDYKSQVEQSINAGMDMVMVPDRYIEFINILKTLVEEGKVPTARIDDAVKRILRVKFAMGLMDKSQSVLADRSLWKSFGSAKHRRIARECVRESLVLLKNENKALPMSKHLRRIHVGGKSADDIGNQCGGWTISWQGQSGNITSGGSTILQSIRNTVSNNTKVTYVKDGASSAADCLAHFLPLLLHKAGTGTDGRKKLAGCGIASPPLIVEATLRFL